MKQKFCDGGGDAAIHVLPVVAALPGGLHLRARDRHDYQGVRELHQEAVQALAGTHAMGERTNQRIPLVCSRRHGVLSCRSGPG